ncbi:hypothetical protein OSTOST_19563, partial [Ostertagia ostertagi]
MYLVMVKKDQWHDVVHYAARALEKLINKCYFTHKDLVLEWEPVYDLYYGAAYGKLEDVDGGRIRTATFRLKRFYRPSESPKIWEKDHRKYGAALWFQTMWKMYEVVEMGKKWGDDLPNFFATLIYHNPDFMDWGPLYDTIFTRIIRAMGLCVREGKITVGDGSGSSSLDGFARFVSSTIGGPCSCQKQLEKMMRTIEPFLHPANEGDHTALVLSFLQYLIREFLGRYEDERIKKIKRKVGFSEIHPKESMHFTSTTLDTDVRLFVDTLLQSILYSLYSKDGKSYDLPAKLLMMLGTLEPGHVFPRFLDNVYPAVFAVCEPHRLTQTLDCMFRTGVHHRQRRETGNRTAKDGEGLGSRNGKVPFTGLSNCAIFITKSKWDLKSNFTTFRFHLFYFLEILIAGIDINDVSKANISIHNLTLIFYIMPILDYSECVKHHKDLTPDEKSLCLLSARLPVLAEMALDRYADFKGLNLFTEPLLIFRMLGVIQCLAVTAPKDSSSALGNFKDESTKESEEERVLKKGIDRCVTALFTNTKYAIT